MKSFYQVLFFVVSITLASCSNSGSALVVTASSSATALSLGLKNVVRTLNDEGPSIGSPSSTTMKMYALYVSTSEDCSSPTLVQDYGSDGVDKNLFQSNLVLFSGNPPDGTYKCMIIKVSDNIVFQADSQAVNASGSPCQADTDYTIDIYRTDSGDTWKDIDGNDITPTGSDGSPGADVVYIFATRDPSAVPEATAHQNQIGELADDLVVPGRTSFYADGTNQVVDNGTECGLNGLTMGFQ